MFSWGFGNSFAHPHFHSSKGLSRNPVPPAAASPGGMCALDPSWEQSRPGDKTRDRLRWLEQSTILMVTSLDSWSSLLLLGQF